MSESIATLLNSATEILVSSDSARLDAEILLQHVLGKDRSYLYSHSEEVLQPEQIDNFKKLLQQRFKGIPIAYLIGSKEFWSLSFAVTPDTLIPRPETELLIETVLNIPMDDSKLKLLDLGTGTGAIAIALATELPGAKITATDNSDKALDVAKYNAQANQTSNINFIKSDWFSTLEAKTFDFIISNPPYISESDPHLSQGDVQFEPISALASGNKGLDDLEIIISQAQNYLEPKGFLLVEHGYQQGQAVTCLMEQNNYQSIKSLFDFSKHHRATLARKK